MPDVLDADRHLDRINESRPESLQGRISIREMGSRLVRHAPRSPRRGAEAARHDAHGESAAQAFIYPFFDDVPEETLEFATRTILAIMGDESFEEMQRKAEVDELLGTPLSGVQFDELRQISQEHRRRQASQLIGGDAEMDIVSEESVDGMGQAENLDMDADEDVASGYTSGLLAPNEEEPKFVALNDPIRLRDKSIVRPQDVDADWLQRALQGVEIAPETILRAMTAMEGDSYDTKLRKLDEILGHEHYYMAMLLAKNTTVIVWYTLLAQADTGTKREEILATIQEKSLDIEHISASYMDQDFPRELDLQVTGRPIDVPLHENVKLPQGSTKFTTRDYDQYNVPSEPESEIKDIDWPLRAIRDLPDFAQPCFSGLKTLNLVQSKACDVVAHTDTNILLCAPTGAGKTNIALLALARCTLLQGLKALYISPLKALVQEQVAEFSRRFSQTKASVAELSGDQSLSRDQLRDTDIIIATPEKWDIVSRKASNADLVRNIGLLIIDEIHLLNDETRGGVVENIVARHKLETMPPRLLGLSATLPNYEEVARFLDVPPAGLFYFDSRFRPVPLEQHFVGVTSQGPLKQLKVINEVCASKVSEITVGAGRQALVFVHSRKDTEITRQFLAGSTDLALNQIGTHHAGLERQARFEAEAAFKDGKFRVLVCTATLAWGVNLPAAAVIIKGTQYYDPVRQSWRQLSSQDVLQMFGRAGRPGYDTEGLGIIITTEKYLGYFASVATFSRPIESHLIARIADSINAEIAAYTIQSLDDGIRWLRSTFWAVRAESDPATYGDQYSLADVVHSVFLHLQKQGACRYDYPNVRPSFLGDVSAMFYISPASVATYGSQLKPWLADIDLIRVFARAAEFSSMTVRQGEALEVERLASLVPIPLRDDLHTPQAKIGVLLQAYISRLPLNGLAISADMAYIAQSASRLFRAFFETAMRLGWCSLALRSHRLFLMVDKRIWFTGYSPLRQFLDCPEAIISRVEKSPLPWQRYFDLEESDLTNVFRLPSNDLGGNDLAHTLYNYLEMFPRFNLAARCQPLTFDWLLATIDVAAVFQFNAQYHQLSEQFLLLVEDHDRNLLYRKRLRLRELLTTSGTAFSLQASIHLSASKTSRKYPPYLYARLISERWLHAEYETPINMRLLVAPAQGSELSTIVFGDDEPSKDEASADDAEYASGTRHQTSLARWLSPLLVSDRPAYLGLPPSLEEEECFESVLAYALKKGQQVLVIRAQNDIQDDAGDGAISSFDAENSARVGGSVRYMNAQDAERLSRVQARLHRALTGVDVIVLRGLSELGSRSGGDRLELLVTRIRATSQGVRLVGIGLPIVSARSVAQWLGASKADVANFGHDVLESRPEVELRAVESPGSNIVASLRSVKDYLGEGRGTLAILTSSRRGCTQIRHELLMQGLMQGGDPETVHVWTLGECAAGVARGKLTRPGVAIVLGADELSARDVVYAVATAAKKVVIFTDPQQRGFVESCLESSLPCESQLHLKLADAMIPEICAHGTWSPQEAVDWLSGTFLYRRLRANPGYYGAHDSLQDWVSEAVESTFEHLHSVGAVSLNEETLEVQPTALAHIVAHDGVELQDVVGDTDVTEGSGDGLGGLGGLGGRVLLASGQLRVCDARIHYALAMNDLERLFRAVDLRQSVRQKVPLGASPLLQIPHFDDEIVLRCHDAGIKSMQEFIAIEDDGLRSQLLGFDNEDARMLDVADFVNRFPIVDITEVSFADDASRAIVTIERDMEEEEVEDDDGEPGLGDDSAIADRQGGAADADREVDDLQSPRAQPRPAESITVNGTSASGQGGWHLVIGSAETGAIAGYQFLKNIDRSTVGVELGLSGATACGRGRVSVWLMSGDYLDADKEFHVSEDSAGWAINPTSDQQ